MMRRNELVKSLVTLLSAAVLSISAFAGNLNLSAGTWSAGGDMAFRMQKAAGANFGDSDYGLEGHVSVGYFVSDYWELRGFMGTEIAFNELVGTAREFKFKEVSLGVGTDYYFNIDSIVYPYLGLSVRGKATPSTTPVIWSLGVQPRVGMLIELNCDVALDIGLRADIEWALNGQNSSGNPEIDAELGYFGVKGFF